MTILEYRAARAAILAPSTTGGTMGSMTDWISAISSLVGAVVGALVLLAVYHTWTQIFARRQI